MMDLSTILKEHGQERLLEFPTLTPEENAAFVEQLLAIDWEGIKLPEGEKPRGTIRPIAGLGVSEIEARKEEFEAVGTQAVREGKVAAVLLAGGQGTRLGSDAPKGVYDIGITRSLTIFEQLIRNLMAVSSHCGVYIPLLIMTSEKNDEETRAYFSENGNFGYPAQFIRFFKQEMTVCVDLSGELLLEGRGKLALSPNGNGGWYASMKKAGADRDFPFVEWYNVFSVDNVLQRMADPVFVGATILSGAKCGAKVVCKTSPGEKVGVLCLEDGTPSVIEYYELSPEMACERDENGNLSYRYGVILNYLFQAKRLEEIAEEKIPVHAVKKKIPYYGREGKMVQPEKENGYKFETLILDMVKLAGSCLPFEVVREREFAPIKNKTGVDSVATAQELLQKNGVIL